MSEEFLSKHVDTLAALLVLNIILLGFIGPSLFWVICPLTLLLWLALSGK